MVEVSHGRGLQPLQGSAGEAGVGARPSGLQPGHGLPNRRQFCSHGLVLGVERADRRPGDANGMQRWPRDVVFALMVLGQLVVDVPPGAMQADSRTAQSIVLFMLMPGDDVA
jgi:hypothetical protein